MLGGLRRSVALASGVLVVLSACSNDDAVSKAVGSNTTNQVPTSSVQPSRRAATTTSVSIAPPTTTSVPSSAPADTTTSVAEPAFTSQIMSIGPKVQTQMNGRSMRANCPVPYAQLRYLKLAYWGFDNTPHEGELIVNADVAETVVTLFERLFEIHFPIERMQLVDDYGPGRTSMDGANDFASIEANNTSAFNCRARTGSTTQYSEHSYGRAIDLNPLLNPYVSRDGTTAHPKSKSYLDRSIEAPGVVTENSRAVQIFKDAGWGWGGDWSGIKDYQHFSSSGR